MTKRLAVLALTLGAGLGLCLAQYHEGTLTAPRYGGAIPMAKAQPPAAAGEQVPQWAQKMQKDVGRILALIEEEAAAAEQKVSAGDKARAAYVSLLQKCASCHSLDKAPEKAEGVALFTAEGTLDRKYLDQPGGRSRISRRIHSKNPNLQMPPPDKSRLTAEEIAEADKVFGPG